MHMRTTLNIDDRMLREAMEMTGIKEKTALIHAGLQALITREAGRRLIALGGKIKDIKVPPRRRPDFSKLASKSRKAG